jgi:hypothetical protein
MSTPSPGGGILAAKTSKLIGAETASSAYRLGQLMTQLGQKQKWLSLNGISALPSTADMRRLHRHVGFVPTPEVVVQTKSRPKAALNSKLITVG